MNGNQDRRVIKTTNALKTALIDLMKNMEYNCIRLNDILNKANIGRSTFYLHFENKDDLLHVIFYEMEQDFSEYFKQNQKDEGDWNKNISGNIYYKAIQYIDNNQSIFIALLLNSGLTRFEQYLYEYLYNIIVLELKAKTSETDNLSLFINAHYKTSGFIGLIKLWLKDEITLSKFKDFIEELP